MVQTVPTSEAGDVVNLLFFDHTYHRNRTLGLTMYGFFLSCLLSLCAFGFCIFGTPAFASTDKATAKHYQFWQQQAQSKTLYELAEWRRLLYLPSKVSTTKEQKSKVTQQQFFLGDIKTTTPKEEMLLLIKGMFEPSSKDNESVACRFPARVHWVRAQLNMPKNAEPEATCSNFDEWFAGIAPYKTTLVFASDYLNNPSSMFGHTLLRIDQNNKGQSLLSYAVNYAAETQAGNGLSFAYKGLTGAYSGMFSIMPYYEKVKDYGDLESRDLWEYELNLTQAQTEQLVRHVWEMGGIKFPYYFLSDNCAYALLGLLDVVTPNLDSQSWFTKEAIPAQTIKELSERTKLVKSVHFRPALESQLKAQWFLYGNDIAQKAHVQTKDEKLAFALGAADEARVLEMAYDDLYLRYLKHKDDKDTQTANKARLRELLLLRSRNPSPEQRPKLLTPDSSPADGHDARRLGFTLGYEQPATNRTEAEPQGYTELAFRGAYHDLLDPPQGYRSGMSIEVLDIALRVYKDRVRLDKATLIGIDSYAPKSPFAWPVSWGISGGAKQADGKSKDALVGYLDYHIGYAVGYGYGFVSQHDNGVVLTENTSFCYAQLSAKAQAGNSLDVGWRLGLGPKVGCLHRFGNTFRLSADASSTYWLSNKLKTDIQSGAPHTEEYGLLTHAEVLAHYDITKRNALRFRLSGQLHEDNTLDDADVNMSLSWLYYYF